MGRGKKKKMNDIVIVNYEYYNEESEYCKKGDITNLW